MSDSEHAHIMLGMSLKDPVQFRYESFEDLGGDLDRAEVILRVKKLVKFVEKLIKDGEATG
jgi:hypothetical protein